MQDVHAVLAFLQSLAPTGDRGFEGLICTILGSETGQRFVRVWSGDQRGRDAQSTTMAMEAKHYFASRLSQRELIAEIHQAALLRPRPELWLLVTPVAVDPDNWQELTAIAGEKGLDTLAIDGTSRGVSRLLALLAAQSADVLAFAATHRPSTDQAALEADFHTIAAHPAFIGVLAELRTKLRSTLLGHADAARRCNERLLRILAHEGDARSEFAQSAGVRVPGILMVRRAEPYRLLTHWLDGQAKQGVHVVALGEEGVGKTWAVLDWVEGLYASGREIVVLPFSATAVALTRGQTIADLLPGLLARWTGVGDTASWGARLLHWLGDDMPRLLILVVADGLNERTDVAWPNFFRSVGQSSWAGRIAVLATDRPLHWVALSGPLATHGFQAQMQIGPYTDRELPGGGLAGSGIDIGDVPAEMLPLIKTARYCRLAVKHQAAMRTEGDLTRERLTYIDARERATEKANYPVSEDEFNEIIRGAARRHREIARTLRAADILKMIPFRERERDVYFELTTGGVFVADGGSDRFRVEPARLAYALGLLLSEAVREDALAGATPEAIADGIARWFEPERDADLKVEAAAGGLFHATIDETFPAAGRRELLRYWLSLRNWGEEASAAFVGYILRMPEDFVAMAEHFWAEANDRGAAQALLARAFVMHRDALQVRPHLVEATERWFGFVHLDGLPILRQVPDSSPAEPSPEEIAERVAAITSHTSSTLPPLTSIADDGLLRLSQVGLLVASAGARLPFAQGLITRALAASAMGMDTSPNEAGWVVRLAEPELVPILLQTASLLAVSGDPSCLSAAHRLLGGAEDQASRALLDANPPPRHRSQDWLDRHKEDPCASGFSLSGSEYAMCLAREDVTVESLLRGCRLHILAGEVIVPDSFVDRCLAALREIPPEKVAAAFGFTYEDHLITWMEMVLASTRPAELAEFWRGVVRHLAGRDVDLVGNFSHRLPGLIIALTSAEHATLHRCCAVLDTAADEPGRRPDAGGGYNQFHMASAQFAEAALAHMPPDERWDMVARRPLTAFDPLKMVNWYSVPPVPSPEAQAQALKVIRREGAEARLLLRALYFAAACRTVLDDETKDAVIRACRHENPAVRGSALRLVNVAGDEGLAQQVIDLGDAYHSDKFWPAVNGSNLIVCRSSILPVQTIVERLHPASWTFAAHWQRRSATDLDFLGEALDAVLRRILDDPTAAPSDLPSITAGSDQPSGLGWPVNQDEQDSPTTEAVQGSWLAPRPATKPVASADVRIEEWMRRADARTAALHSAWQTDAFAWFGRSFDVDGLRGILERRPDLWRQWAAPALDAGRHGLSIRLRLGTFYHALAGALLALEPALGLQVWNKLADDNERDLPGSTVAEISFRSDSPEAMQARRRVVDSCWNDAQLAEIAVAAARHSRTRWLQKTISELIRSPELWRRAKGLCLASLSVLETTAFEGYVEDARVADTWVCDQLQIYRQRHALDRRGLHWFQIFGTAADEVTAWGAWRMMVACADARWTTWTGCWNDASKPRRLAFLSGAAGELKRACEETERERRDLFLGLKITRGEVFPFAEL